MMKSGMGPQKKKMGGKMESLIVESLKETIKQSVLSGAKVTDGLSFVAKKFGNEMARLIAIDLALDLGFTEEAVAYFNCIGSE